MQIETIGNYQMHLIALELSGSKGWDPYVAIFKFDNEAHDFQCVLEKHHASDHAFPSYESAIEQARRVGNAFIEEGDFPEKVL